MDVEGKKVSALEKKDFSNMNEESWQSLNTKISTNLAAAHGMRDRQKQNGQVDEQETLHAQIDSRLSNMNKCIKSRRRISTNPLDAEVIATAILFTLSNFRNARNDRRHREYCGNGG